MKDYDEEAFILKIFINHVEDFIEENTPEEKTFKDKDVCFLLTKCAKKLDLSIRFKMDQGYRAISYTDLYNDITGFADLFDKFTEKYPTILYDKPSFELRDTLDDRYE
jgi:hypothetical protein